MFLGRQRIVQGVVGGLADRAVWLAHEGQRRVEGQLLYLAVFGNIDLGGDRIVKGAFAKSIGERVPAGKVPYMAMHFAYGGDVMEMIGKVSQAKEDDFGLWIHADLLGDPASQAMRSKIVEARQMGLSIGQSVGYRTVAYDISEEEGRTVYNLKELVLCEGTITVRPMNELARLTDAKTMEREEMIEALAASLNVPKDTICAALAKRQAGPTAPAAGSTEQQAAALSEELEDAIRNNRIYLELERMNTL